MVPERQAVMEFLAGLADGSASADLPPQGESEELAEALVALRLLEGVAALHRTPGDEAVRGRVVGRIGESAVIDAAPRPEHWNGLQLLERLGEGSYGEVYAAYDPKLERKLAVKLFKARSSQRGDIAARVLREGRALAQINHDHVVEVLGASTDAGRLGLWMELVEGRTLEAVLGAEGRFGAREAGIIGQAVCSALSAVHQAGLVHGDIKAQNVMRERGGRIVLMDFGSWRYHSGAEDAGVSRTGTPLYLAPEVLAGEPASVASDIYALGVLLFYLVTGTYPLRADSQEALGEAHVRGERTRIQDARPGLHDGFARTIERALSRDPGDRFGTAGEFQSALGLVWDGVAPVSRHRPAPLERHWLRPFVAVMIAVAVLTGCAIAASLLWRTPVSKDSVTVLPFRSIGAPPEMAYFADALSSEVAAQLSRLPHIRVITPGPAAKDRGQLLTADAIGADLGAATLVAGTIQFAGDAVHVAFSLVDAGQSRQLVGDSFVGSRRDLQSVQARVVRLLGTALRGQLSRADAQRLFRQQMTSEAFDLYLLGRYYREKRTRADLQTSLEYLRQAHDLEPGSGAINAGLADSYLLAGIYHAMPVQDSLRLSEAAAHAAIAADSSLAEAHAALASVYHEEWRLAEAGQAFATALSLNPSYVSAHHWYAVYLAQTRRLPEARYEIEYAASLDPQSPAIETMRGIVTYLLGDAGQASAQFQSVLDKAPDFYPAHSSLAEAYAVLGRYTDALNSLAQVARLTGGDNGTRGIEAYVRAAMGDRVGALRLLALAEGTTDSTDWGATDVAAVYALLGQPADVRRWLDRAARVRDGALLYGGIEPRYQRLRSYPEFTEVLLAQGLGAVIGGQ